MPAVPARALTNQQVTIVCDRCGRANTHSIGACDSTQAICTHRSFVKRPEMGRYGMLECTNGDCKLRIDIGTLIDHGIDLEARYTVAGQKLADEAQTLRDENTKVFAENTRLRRELEALKEKLGRTR